MSEEPPGGAGLPASGSRLPEKKIVTHYPPPVDDELPPPTFKQALVGYGSIILALVALGLLLGFLIRVLR